MFLTLSKIRLATPALMCKSLPTNATEKAQKLSTFTLDTSLNSVNKSLESRSARMKRNRFVSVKATLTSDVVMVSTEILCLAKMANTFSKILARAAYLSWKGSKVWSRRKAMARKFGRGCGSRVTQVPPSCGALLEPTNTGMLTLNYRKQGCGCNTFAPKVAISAASAKLMVSMRLAAGTMRGSVV